MQRIIASLIFLILFSIPAIAQNIKVAGIASKGGKNVRTSALVQHTLIESYPACTVTVYLTGTLTLASIFTDEIGTPKSNPFTANTDASWWFYVAEGRYDIKFSGTGIISPFTLSDIFVNEGGGGGGSGVSSWEGRTGAVVVQNGDVGFNQLDFTGSNFNSIVTRSASDLNAGTLPDARFPAILPAISGINLTNLNASNIASGTLNDARLSSNVPLKNAVNTFTANNIFNASVGLNTSSPDRRMEILDGSNPQLRLTSIDGSQFTDFFVDSGGSLVTTPTGNIIFDATGNQVNPLNNFDQNLGQINKKYLSLHAAELFVETLVAQNTIATIGGRIIVAPSNILIADLASASTTINVKYNNLNNGDRIYMEGNLAVEFMAVTSSATPITGGFSYTVTRNLDGTGANDWFAGDAMVNTGVSGSGFIDLYSIRGVKSSSQVGPTIVGNVRNSNTFNDWTENWAIGNLNGLCGYGVDTFGVCLGKYAAGSNHVTLDNTNGLRIFNGLSTIVGQWAISGDVTVGQVAASQSNVFISSGNLSLRNNTAERIGLSAAGILTIKDSGGNAVITLDASTGAEITRKLTMPGSNSAISIGTTPPTSASAGTGIWIDRTGIFGLLSDVVQAKLDSTTGAITAGASNVILDVSGIAVKASSAFAGDRTYRIVDGSTTMGTFWADIQGIENTVHIETLSIASKSSAMKIDSFAPASFNSQIFIAATVDGSVAARVDISSITGITLRIGSSNTLTIDPNNNISLGTGSMSLGATDGFAYIRTMSGAPTGTPTSKSGRVPMVYDVTNNHFYIYNSGWKKVLLAP